MGYTFILVGFIFQILLSAASGIFMDLLYTDYAVPWIKSIRWIFAFYPSYNFAKLFTDISLKSANTISISGGQIIKGTVSFSIILFSRIF